MRRLLVIAWSESLRCPSHRIVRVIAWSESSHGPSHRMVRVIAWSKSLHGPSHCMVRVIAWSGDSRRRTLGRARDCSGIAFVQCSRMPAVYRKRRSVCGPDPPLRLGFSRCCRTAPSPRAASAPPSPHLMCATSKRRDRRSQAREPARVLVRVSSRHSSESSSASITRRDRHSRA